MVLGRIVDDEELKESFAETRTSKRMTGDILSLNREVNPCELRACGCPLSKKWPHNKETDHCAMNDPKGADDMSDHDKWTSYSHWGMFKLDERFRTSRPDH